MPEQVALYMEDLPMAGEQDRRRGVDRHRGGDAAERDPLEEPLHVGEGVDGDALATDLAERQPVVGVVAHQRRHVERGREAGLPVREQVAEALVRLLRARVAGVLAHRPLAAAVHVRVDSAREGILARLAEALRENLRKRKAQARAQRAEDAPQRGCTQSAADSAKS